MDANTIFITAGIATIIAGIIAVIKFLFDLKDSIHKLDSKIDNVDAKLTSKIGNVDAKIDLVHAELKSKSDLFDTKFNTLDKKVEVLETDFRNINKELIHKAFGKPANGSSAEFIKDPNQKELELV